VLHESHWLQLSPSSPSRELSIEPRVAFTHETFMFFRPITTCAPDNNTLSTAVNFGDVHDTCRAVIDLLRQMLFTRAFQRQLFEIKLFVMYGYVFCSVCCSHFLQAATQPANALP
jgi:hypothetical protein